MPIGPVSNSHRQISVVEPLSPAFERVKQMLFQPFEIGKWFVIGFCAWLAQLGESGGSANFSQNNFNGNHYNNSTDNFRHGYTQVHDYILENLYWLVPLVIFCVVLGLAIWVLIVWLNSRGKFMLLHCVALNKAEVTEPWNKYAAQGNSLFRFRLVLGLIGMAVMLPMLLIMGVLIIKMVLAGQPVIEAILMVAGLAMVFIVLVIILGLIQKFTVDFVVPIMYLRGGTCLQAWGEFWRLLCANPGLFALYILFQLLISIAIGIIVVGVFVLTCCIACCLAAIPYIGTVLLLPIFIFKRSFSIYFLRQFGPEYDVFPTAPPTAPAPSGLQPFPGAS
ncbi:MAG TPA: hypothetical protein VGI03_01545 [Verrucomicrobiae bacterium]|jgi:hypothetical protein